MIHLVNVSKYYKSTHTVSLGIRKVNLEFQIGEFVAITGESGSGKSTLLNILSGLDTFEEGEFFLFNEPTSHYTIAQWESYRAAYVGFVFQNYNIIDSYTVYQNVIMALEFQGYDEESRKKRALEIIDRVGLSHRVNHKSSKLSGGEKQRTVIARALAKDCPAILCDEPTGNLDSQTGEEIIKLLKEISKDKLIIIVTHNYPEISEYATRLIRMSDGEIIEDIKKVEPKKTDKIHIQEKHINFKTIANIGLRNLFASPKRFIFLLLLQAVFVFLAFLIYGSTNSLFYQSSLLPDAIEASEHQLVVQRIDGASFSDEEVLMFENNRYVQAVNHYETSTTLFTSIGRTRIFTERIEVLKDSDLIEGSEYPKSIDEIIISEDLSIFLDSTIGDVLTLRTSLFEPYPFTVSGISNRISKAVYFHDDFFSNPTYTFKSIVNRISMNIVHEHEEKTQINGYRNFIVEEEYPDLYATAYVTYDVSDLQTVDLMMESGYGTNITIPIEANLYYSEAISEIRISSFLYQTLQEEMLSYEHRYKIVLNVYDRYDGTRLKNQIDQTTYVVYYEALTQDQNQSNFGYLMQVIAYTLILITGFMMLIVFRIVFKHMVQTRRKDFAIYRSIGASKGFLGRLIFMEQIFQITFGTLITASLSIIIILFVPTVQRSLRFVSIIDILIIIFVYAYMAIITPLRYQQSIYEISVIDTLTRSGEASV